MRHLILGHGEVGKAIHKILGEAEVVDLNYDTWNGGIVDVIHVCIPYSPDFNQTVEQYKKEGLVIVHSTVPLGTCDKLDVVHSPIRGVHPKLEQGIRTFVKYFGGRKAIQASKIFQDLGIKVKVFQRAKTTEAIKLWDTTQYGKLILLEKEIHAWCKKNEVNFESVYRRANQDYNEGYMALGKPEVVRPYLRHVEGPIGGHCVRENAKLLGIIL